MGDLLNAMNQLLLALIFTLTAFAATKPSDPKPVKAELTAPYWRAVAIQQSFLPQWQAYNRAVQDAIEAMKKECGPNRELQGLDSNPVCVEKPKPAAAPKPAAKTK